MREGVVYKGPVPFGLTKVEESVWNDLCHKPHVVKDLVDIELIDELVIPKDVVANELNDSCMHLNLRGNDVINYDKLIEYYEKIVSIYLTDALKVVMIV
jgi:hypothetical protein